MLRTSEQVGAALADVVAATAPYRDAYEAWAARYCPWDDGGAAARVVDAVFDPVAGGGPGGRARATAVTDGDALPA
jgi:CDP-glycerol glycerophosphotransferase